MFKETKMIFLALFCLILAGGGCKSATPTGPVIHPTPSLTPWSTVVDRGLLYGEPCAPPCWEGIIPGVSSREDVEHILDQLKSEGKVKGSILSNHFVRWPSGDMDVIFDDGYVNYMRIRYSYLREFDYQVRQVIERFGEPEACISFEKAKECPCKKWDDATAYTTYTSAPIILLYPSQGVTIRVAVAGGWGGCICPEMRTSTFYYYRPRSLTEALQEEKSPVFGGHDEYHPDRIVPWRGYGPVY